MIEKGYSPVQELLPILKLLTEIEEYNLMYFGGKDGRR